MSSSRWPGWECCEKHDTLRPTSALKVSRVVTDKRTVDGKERVVETRFYECVDGACPPSSSGYDGKFGENPFRRGDPPAVADPEGLAFAKALMAQPQPHDAELELEIVVTRLPEKENGSK